MRDTCWHLANGAYLKLLLRKCIRWRQEGILVVVTVLSRLKDLPIPAKDQYAWIDDMVSVGDIPRKEWSPFFVQRGYISTGLLNYYEDRNGTVRRNLQKTMWTTISSMPEETSSIASKIVEVHKGIDLSDIFDVEEMENRFFYVVDDANRVHMKTALKNLATSALAAGGRVDFRSKRAMDNKWDNRRTLFTITCTGRFSDSDLRDLKLAGGDDIYSTMATQNIFVCEKTIRVDMVGNAFLRLSEKVGGFVECLPLSDRSYLIVPPSNFEDDDIRMAVEIINHEFRAGGERSHIHQVFSRGGSAWGIGKYVIKRKQLRQLGATVLQGMRLINGDPGWSIAVIRAIILKLANEIDLVIDLSQLSITTKVNKESGETMLPLINMKSADERAFMAKYGDGVTAFIHNTAVDLLFEVEGGSSRQETLEINTTRALALGWGPVEEKTAEGGDEEDDDDDDEEAEAEREGA